MRPRPSRALWLAWGCLVLGVAVCLVAALRAASGRPGAWLLTVGLPLLAYGALMARAVRPPPGP